MRLVAFYLLAMVFLVAPAIGETYAEPAVFDVRMGPLAIHGYERRTSLTWGAGTEYLYMEVPIPFYALVTGLAVAVVLLGIVIFLRRRLMNHG